MIRLNLLAPSYVVPLMPSLPMPINGNAAQAAALPLPSSFSHVRKGVGCHTPLRRPQLSREEEIALHHAVQKGGDEGAFAVEKIVARSQGLVRGIARAYRGRGVEYDDLLQEGNIGLLKAVRKYRYRRGYRFSTYAAWWVRKEILDMLKERTRTIRVPGYVYTDRKFLIEMREQIKEERGSYPEDEELAEIAELPLRRVKRSLSQGGRAVESLQDPLDGTERFGETKLARLQDDAAPIDELAERTLLVPALLRSLDPPLRRVIELCYGLDPIRFGKEMEDGEIGRLLGLSHLHVQQMRRTALQQLQRSLKRRSVFNPSYTWRYDQLSLQWIQGELNAQERELFHLSFTAGMGEKGIAKLLGLTEADVSTRRLELLKRVYQISRRSALEAKRAV